jgi:hypothetical protein
VGLGDTRQVADDDCFCSGHRSQSLFSPLLATCVQYCSVPLLDEQLSGHPAEAVGRTCNEDARHGYLSPCFVKMRCFVLRALPGFGLVPKEFKIQLQPRLANEGTMKKTTLFKQ